jgi:hypothetical protein
MIGSETFLPSRGVDFRDYTYAVAADSAKAG